MGWLKTRQRSIWLRAHRWLGLALGPVFALLGLTGGLLVFYTEVDALIEPALAVTGPMPAVVIWQPVLEALQRDHPQREQGWRIELLPNARGIVTARYLKPVETRGAFLRLCWSA